MCDADPIRFIGVCRRAPSRPSKSPWRTRGLFGLAACLVSFQPDSNRRPSASEADALSTELWNVGGFPTRTHYASPSGASVGLAGLEPATSRPPAGRATDCAAIRRAFLPTGGDGTPLREPCDRRTCPACGENATFMPHPRRALGRIRTGDAHLRKVALYPLSYRGVCRLVARASQLVFRFDGIHVVLSLVAMALRLPRLSPTGMMVFIARSTRPLDCPSVDGPRDSTPRFLAVRRCDRASRGIRTHNPRFKRPLL